MKPDVKKILEELINYSRPVSDIKKELAVFNRKDIVDISDDFVLTKQHILNAMQKFLNHEINEENLVEWADLVEGRDGIKYEDQDDDDKISMVLSWLSTPEINGIITEERIREYMRYVR